MTQSESDERKIKFIEANMEFEGFQIDEDLREMCEKVLKGEVTGDDAVQACICRYKKDR